MAEQGARLVGPRDEIKPQRVANFYRDILALPPEFTACDYELLVLLYLVSRVGEEVQLFFCEDSRLHG